MKMRTWVLGAALLAMGALAADGQVDVVVNVPVPVPAPMPPVVSVDSTIIQRDGDTLRLLNTTVYGADGKALSHLDVAIKLRLDAEGKVRVELADARPTTVVGVDALVAGVYEESGRSFTLKGPALDVDLRPSWTIEGKGFNGTLVSGPAKGHPHLAGMKGIDSLPEAGVYGVVSHDRAFGGIGLSSKTLVNLRQVADTIVITGYAQEKDKFVQTGVVVLKAKKGGVVAVERP